MTKTKVKNILMGIILVACFLVVGEMDYQDQLGYEQSRIKHAQENK